MQSVEPLIPQRPVSGKPLIDFGQRLGAETVDPALRLLANLDQPGLPEHPKVP